MTTHWLPSATLQTLRQRATLIAAMRHFFASRDVLEVETPALMPTTATDIYIDSYRLADSPLLFANLARVPTQALACCRQRIDLSAW